MTDRPLRVCLVAPVPPPYGGISHWAQMIIRHASSRPDVRILIVDIAPRWRAIHDLTVWKRVIGGGLQFVRDLAKLLWVLLRHRPDAVHLTTSGQLGLVRDLAVLTAAKGFRLGATYHIRFGRIPEIAEAGTREWRLIRRAMALARTVIAIDRATEDAIRRHVPGVRVERVPNCVESAEAVGAAPANPQLRSVMYLGWVIPKKGMAELVDAWSRVRTTGWRLIIAGPGEASYRQSLLERCEAAGIEFTGELGHEHAMGMLASADALVLPSYTEGFPNVVLEAMERGKAIVATAVGGIPEMLSDGCGLLVTPGDRDELANALKRIVNDGELRAQMGQRARARAHSEYSIAAVFDRYVGIWRGDIPRSYSSAPVHPESPT